MSERIVRMADYLAAVDEIAGERPEYRIGGDGSDGGCDCIGLTIGAIRRRAGRGRGCTAATMPRETRRATCSP